MRMKHRIFSILCLVAFTVVAHAAPIATGSSSIQPISQYGLIQNVQNYSSNPFWNPSGPYNQRMPQPVYAQGADLNTADCQRTVGTLVASYCVNNNNCVGMQLSDIRPVMMLQLARLPGHNYATSCAGFIDSEFNSYVSKYSNAGPSGNYVPFPTGTVANPNYDNETDFQIENPYQIRDRTWNGEEWEKERTERYRELQELQSLNGADDIHLARADFPATTADLSFSEHTQLKSSGYEPYRNASPYAKPFEIESEEKARNRQEAELRAYCQRHSDDYEKCPTQYCQTHFDDYEKCQTQFCQKHRDDERCKNKQLCEKEENIENRNLCPQEYCARHPDECDDDIDCTKEENAEDYSKCPDEYCENHPTDSQCLSRGGGGGGVTHLTLK